MEAGIGVVMPRKHGPTKYQRDVMKKIKRAIPRAKVSLKPRGRGRHDKLILEIDGLMFSHPLPDYQGENRATKNKISQIQRDVRMGNRPKAA